MSAEAIIPDAVIPAQARNQRDTPSSRHSRASGNPVTFARYPKYKDSGVEWLGEVPDEWATVRLKQACFVAPSNVDKKTYDGQLAVRLCNYTDVYYNDEITDQIEFMAATATDDQVAKFSLKADDVLVTKDSETPDDIAVPAYVPKDLNGVVCGYHLALLRPLANCSGDYLKYLFHSRYLRSTFAVAANGLTRYGLSQYALDNAVVPFPPRHEQKAIAAFLDRETSKIDALIAEQEKLIALLKEKRQALISHAVTKGLDPNAPMKDSGIEWLGQVPAHWEILRAKHFTLSTEQGWSPLCENFQAEGDEWAVLKVGCVNGGQFNRQENKVLPLDFEPRSELSLKAGDLLISRANTRELVGSAAVVGEDEPFLLLCDKLYRLRLDQSKALPGFVAHYLSTPEARGQIELDATGASASMVNIGQATILELPVPIPSINEQQLIIQSLSSSCRELDRLVEQSQRAVELLKERRAALISAAVTGKIDVRDKAASNKQDESRAIAGLMGQEA